MVLNPTQKGADEMPTRPSIFFRLADSCPPTERIKKPWGNLWNVTILLFFLSWTLIRSLKPNKKTHQEYPSRWWFQTFVYFHPDPWGVGIPIWRALHFQMDWFFPTNSPRWKQDETWRVSGWNFRRSQITKLFANLDQIRSMGVLNGQSVRIDITSHHYFFMSQMYVKYGE